MTVGRSVWKLPDGRVLYGARGRREYQRIMAEIETREQAKAQEPDFSYRAPASSKLPWDFSQ